MHSAKNEESWLIGAWDLIFEVIRPRAASIAQGLLALKGDLPA